MELAGDEVRGSACPGVEVGGIGHVVGIHRHQYPFVFPTPLKDDLPVGEDHVAIAAIAESTTLLPDFRHGGDGVGEIVPLRFLQSGAQTGVSLILVPLDAPFTAVVEGRNPRHAEEDTVSGENVAGLIEHAGDAGDVVVIEETEKGLSPIEGPLLRAKLPLEAVADLEEVHGVEAGPETLVALVVGDAVTHLVIHPAVVIPVESFAHKDKVRLEPIGEGAQLPQVVLTETIGHIQPQTVDIELLHPGADGVKLVLDHGRVVEVQLHQLVVALPALVPEAVVVVGVSVKAQMEPVLVGAVPLFLLYVPEGPEAPADMVEYAIQHDPQARLVEGVTYCFEVLVGTQTAVHRPVVPGVIAVAVALEEGVEEYGVRAGFPDVVHPVQKLQDAVGLDAVVVQGRPAQAQGVDLVDHCIIKPQKTS